MGHFWHLQHHLRQEDRRLSTTFWSYFVRIPILALFIPFDMEHVRALTPQNF